MRHCLDVIRSTTSPSSGPHKLATPRRWTVTVAAAAMLAASLTGCGITVPKDPDGTLDTATHGELRVGVSSDPGLVNTDRATPAGSAIDLVNEFAERLDATPDWTVASEETLVGLLEEGDLDLLVGGFTADTPWVDHAGVTRGYTTIDGADGRSIVFLVPLGENAFLTELETFLDEEVGS